MIAAPHDLGGLDSTAGPRLERTRVAVGCDLQAENDVGVSLATFGRRYTDRILGHAERCRPGLHPEAAVSARFLAGRFAAKEATFKLLGARPTDSISWADIAIESASGGQLTVSLGGRAADLARQIDLFDISVSISHQAGFAMAVAAGNARADTHIQLGSIRSRDRSEPSRVRSAERECSTMTDSSVRPMIEEILAEHAHLSVDTAGLADTANLYDAGMTSHASINVMLGIEDAFDAEFPDELLNKQTFSSIETIAAAVERIRDAS